MASGASDGGFGCEKPESSNGVSISGEQLSKQVVVGGGGVRPGTASM